jgi:hypothetical protein
MNKKMIILVTLMFIISTLLSACSPAEVSDYIVQNGQFFMSKDNAYIFGRVPLPSTELLDLAGKEAILTAKQLGDDWQYNISISTYEANKTAIENLTRANGYTLKSFYELPKTVTSFVIGLARDAAENFNNPGWLSATGTTLLRNSVSIYLKFQIGLTTFFGFPLIIDKNTTLPDGCEATAGYITCNS